MSCIISQIAQVVQCYSNGPRSLDNLGSNIRNTSPVAGTSGGGGGGGGGGGVNRWSKYLYILLSCFVVLLLAPSCTFNGIRTDIFDSSTS